MEVSGIRGSDCMALCAWVFAKSAAEEEDLIWKMDVTVMKANGTLKGKGKVNLTGRVGHICQFQQHLPQPMSISLPIRQKLLQQHLSSSHSLPVQLLGIALQRTACWACQLWWDFTGRFPFTFWSNVVELCEFFMTFCLNLPLPMLSSLPVCPPYHLFAPYLCSCLPLVCPALILRTTYSSLHVRFPYLSFNFFLQLVSVKSP